MKESRPHRTRTCNTLIKSQLLCQIELAARIEPTALDFNINEGVVAS